MYGEVYRVQVGSGTSAGFSVRILEDGYMAGIKAKLEKTVKDGSAGVEPGNLVVLQYLHYYHRAKIISVSGNIPAVSAIILVKNSVVDLVSFLPDPDLLICFEKSEPDSFQTCIFNFKQKKLVCPFHT